MYNFEVIIRGPTESPDNGQGRAARKLGRKISAELVRDNIVRALKEVGCLQLKSTDGNISILYSDIVMTFTTEETV